LVNYSLIIELQTEKRIARRTTLRQHRFPTVVLCCMVVANARIVYGG